MRRVELHHETARNADTLALWDDDFDSFCDERYTLGTSAKNKIHSQKMSRDTVAGLKQIKQELA